MAVQDHMKTYNIRDLKVAELSADTSAAYTPGTLVDVPGIRELTVTVTNDAVQLEGDGKVISIVDQGNGYEFSLEQGGLSLDAYKIMVGGTVTETGTTPAEVKRWDSKPDDIRPYFALVGVTKSDDGKQDVHAVLWKAKLTGDFEVGFSYGEFTVPSMEGLAIGRTADDVAFSLITHETPIAAAIESVS